jgi:hypothetical protein
MSSVAKKTPANTDFNTLLCNKKNRTAASAKIKSVLISLLKRNICVIIYFLQNLWNVRALQSGINPDPVHLLR